MTSDELEHELRHVFARNTAGMEIPPQAYKRLLRRDYHPEGANRGLAAALTAAIVATTVGIAIPFAARTASQPGAAGPAVRLASYTFRMPVGYQLTGATSTPCRPIALFFFPPHTKGPMAQSPPYGQKIKAAASSSGGCILLVLASRYTPTTAIPDPEAPAAARSVRVAGYRALIFHNSMLTVKTSIRKTGIRNGWAGATDLYVQLPAGGGQMRDLVIGATGLSDARLIEIAATGLAP